MDFENEKNVLGGVLETCSLEPRTGFHRTGRCQTGPKDHGCHAVCVQVTDEFLEFSKAVGNDLSTPMEAYGFPGLKAGDRWCLCAQRWKEAHVTGSAPIVILEATSEAALKYISRGVLEEFALVDSDQLIDRLSRGGTFRATNESIISKVIINTDRRSDN